MVRIDVAERRVGCAKVARNCGGELLRGYSFHERHCYVNGKEARFETMIQNHGSKHATESSWPTEERTCF